jgi:hypothetical protein
MRDRLVRIEALVKSLHESKGDHEKRLRGLERWRNTVVGAIAVMIFLLTDRVKKIFGA